MEKINKLSLPVTILISSIILGCFYYFSESNKQKSIENQHQVEMSLKTEQDKRDYISKRKVECLAVYKTESGKFNNVESWQYNEPNEPSDNPYADRGDTCEIIYKDKNGENSSNYF